ncbi:hypothetical protein AAHC03_01821 [Spirometra sp. Aus1]
MRKTSSCPRVFNSRRERDFVVRPGGQLPRELSAEESSWCLGSQVKKELLRGQGAAEVTRRAGVRRFAWLLAGLKDRRPQGRLQGEADRDNDCSRLSHAPLRHLFPQQHLEANTTRI